MFTWKSVPVDSSIPQSIPQQALDAMSVVPADPSVSSQPSSAEPTIISKGLTIRGEIISTESLVIQGRVEGSILVEGNRVTVCNSAKVSGNIMAREIAALGEIHGSLFASHSVEIRSEAAITCWVIAPCISIEDGAFFKGDIDTRMPETGIDLKTMRTVAMTGSRKRTNHRAISPHRPTKTLTTNGSVPLQR